MAHESWKEPVPTVKELLGEPGMAVLYDPDVEDPGDCLVGLTLEVAAKLAAGDPQTLIQLRFILLQESVGHDLTGHGEDPEPWEGEAA